MSCGCSSAFDGEDQEQFEQEFDNAIGQTRKERRQERRRNNFDGENVGFDDFNNFVDDAYTDFVDDGEEDQFDDFLTKKMRARAKLKKELKAQGLSSKDAKDQALAQIPRDKLKTILANMQKGKKSDTNGLSQDQKDAVLSSTTDVIKDAVNTSIDNVGQGTSPTPTDVLDDDTKEAGFLGKNGMYIGIGVVVLVAGYFAFGKKLGIRK